MDENDRADLKMSVKKAFDWILHDAPETESAWYIARLLLWLYKPRIYPNDFLTYDTDEIRLQWASDIVKYFFISRRQIHLWFDNGLELMDRVEKLYGQRKEGLNLPIISNN